MAATDQEIRYRLAQEVRRAMDDSDAFTPLYSEGFARDAKCVMQLGMAVLSDKPMFILLQRGVALPAHVRRLAKRVIEFDKDDPDSIERATLAMCDAMATALGVPPGDITALAER